MHRLRISSLLLSLLLATPLAAQPQTSVVELLSKGDRAGALEALRLGADVNLPLADGSTALHWAVHLVDEDLVAQLLSREASAAVQNRYGASPLGEAIQLGSVNMVRQLLEAGADANVANADNQTALMLAARRGVVEIVELLLEAGAEVNAVEQWHGQTALMWAAGNRNGAATQLLIDHGADVHSRATANDWGSQITTEPRAQYRPSGGLTPLLYAARAGCIDCIDAILGAGADINLPNPDGVTPLMIAIDNYHFDTAEHLLAKGANPHVFDWWGRTALYIAVDMHSYRPGYTRGGEQPGSDTSALDVMRLLFEAGVNRDPQLNMHRPGRGGNNGRFVDDLLTTGATPLLRAANSHDLEAVRLLLEYGAQVDLPNVMGVTPLLAAAGFGNARGVLRGTFPDEQGDKVVPVLEVLLNAGADINARVTDTSSHNAVIARMSTMTDREGQTVVFAAAMQGWEEALTYLLERGADLQALDANGKNVLEAAKGNAGGRVDRPVDSEMVALLEALFE